MKRLAFPLCFAIAAFTLGACEKQSADNLPAKYLHKWDAKAPAHGHDGKAPAHGLDALLAQRIPPPTVNEQNGMAARPIGQEQIAEPAFAGVGVVRNVAGDVHPNS